jgi:hypothetical protein
VACPRRMLLTAPYSIVIGQRFNMTIIADMSSGKRFRTVLARCECGIEKEYVFANLRSGNSKSCGACGFRPRKHAKSGSKEYKAWQNMLQRCTNPNNEHYANYCGRGISVCERWLDFRNFLSDMGLCPDGMTLDRTENNAGYEPGNCRWVDMKVQTNNRRTNRLIEYEGKAQSVTQWAAEYQISFNTLKSRLKRGMKIGDALTKPLVHVFHGNKLRD